jgi:acyl-CoA reductase-like NAD-dependent aldehyde dehydrogenase
MSLSVQEFPKNVAGRLLQQTHLMEYAIEKVFTRIFCNTATENPCACVPRGNREDVNAAVASARQAFNSWAHTPAEKRAEIMNAVADEMQRRADGKTRLPRAWW